jgi:hypothetical protein
VTVDITVRGTFEFEAESEEQARAKAIDQNSYPSLALHAADTVDIGEIPGAEVVPLEEVIDVIDVQEKDDSI